MFSVGDRVLVDCPGHVMHGKRCLVTTVDPAFNLAPEGEEPIPALVIFVKGAGLPEPIGIGLAHIAGTAEANWRRAWDFAEADDERQGSLLL